MMTLTTRIATSALLFGLVGTAVAQQPAPASAQPESAATPERQVTLPQALELARRNNPNMVQAQQNLRLANMGRLQSLGSYLPTISANASASKSSSQRVDYLGNVTSGVATNNSSLGLSANLTLFDGFQRGANRRLANATADLDEAALVGQTYATDLATKQAYFNALSTQELVGVSEANLARSEQQLKLTTEKLRLGATTRSDSLSASVDYGNAQLQLIQARANALTAQANLARAIGVVGMVAAVRDTALEIRLTSLDTAALRSEAAANAPAVVQAEASVTAAQASRSASRAPLWPTLSASARQSWAGSQFFPWNSPPVRTITDSTGAVIGTVQNPKYTGTWSVGLTISYPIFNGFQREAGMVQADANLRTARARLRDARLALDANLTQSLTALDAASAQIDVSRTSVASAQENLRMQRERYRLGASTIVDLLTAEATLNQAEVALVQARYNYLIARAQLEAYVGHSL
jgi:outer membrane protein